MRVQIRQAQITDAPAIAAVYAPYVLATPISFEETPPDAAAIAERIAPLLASHAYLVAELQGRVVGYAYGAPHRLRASYRWSVDVGIYLDRDSVGQGIGRALYDALLPALRDQRFVMAYAGITMSNATSIAFHERLGFSRVGVYRNVGHKLGQWWDVGWWELQLNPPSVPAPEPIAWCDMPPFASRIIELRKG